MVDVYGMKNDNQFVNSLLEVIRKRGAMDKLISDSASVEISKRVLDVLWYLQIDSWQSEPYFQHQNYAERRWREIKRLSLWLMGYKGAPHDTWLLCLQYIADIMNLTAVQSLNWRTPIEVLTGQTPDCSIAMFFEFYDEVYYRNDRVNKTFPSFPKELKGYFVGFSHDVGHALTYKILTADTRKIIHRSIIRRASEQRNIQIDPDFSPTQTPTPAFLHSAHDDALREGRVLPTIPAISPDDIFEEQDPDKSISNEDNDDPPPLARRPYNDDSDDEDDDDGEQEDGEPQNGEQPNQQLPAELDIGRTVLMPSNQTVSDFAPRSLSEWMPTSDISARKGMPTLSTRFSSDMTTITHGKRS